MVGTAARPDVRVVVREEHDEAFHAHDDVDHVQQQVHEAAGVVVDAHGRHLVRGPQQWFHRRLRGVLHLVEQHAELRAQLLALRGGHDLDQLHLRVARANVGVVRQRLEQHALQQEAHLRLEQSAEAILVQERRDQRHSHVGRRQVRHQLLRALPRQRTLEVVHVLAVQHVVLDQHAAPEHALHKSFRRRQFGRMVLHAAQALGQIGFPEQSQRERRSVVALHLLEGEQRDGMGREPRLVLDDVLCRVRRQRRHAQHSDAAHEVELGQVLPLVHLPPSPNLEL
mgnify:CR=1 FL=1